MEIATDAADHARCRCEGNMLGTGSENISNTTEGTSTNFPSQLCRASAEPPA